MNCKISLIVIVILFLGCKNDPNSSFAISEICDCYKIQDEQQIDNKLNKCLNGFNSWVDSQNLKIKEKEELGKIKLIEITKNLVRSCSNYQNDFNKMLLRRYDGRSKQLNKAKRDSTINLIEKGTNTAVNKSILAEYEIIEGNIERAIELVNESIEENPKIEISYWVRGFLFHSNGEFKKAIEDFEILKSISKNEQMIQAAELWKINLEKEKNKN